MTQKINTDVPTTANKGGDVDNQVLSPWQNPTVTKLINTVETAGKANVISTEASVFQGPS